MRKGRLTQRRHIFGLVDRARGADIGGFSTSVLDDVETLLTEVGDAVKHFLDALGAVPFPGLQLVDDPEGVAGPVGPRDIAGEPLVRDDGVVLERAGGLDYVDVPALVGSCECVGELGSPDGWL